MHRTLHRFDSPRRYGKMMQNDGEQKKKTRWEIKPGVFVSGPSGVRHGGENSRLPLAFFNDKEPILRLQHENARHRIIEGLAAKGCTTREIAAAVGMSCGAVSNITRQPFARAKIQEAIENNMQSEIRDILERAAPGALKRQVSMAENGFDSDTGMYRSELAKKCDDAILDRFLGKPTQPIVDKPTNVEDIPLKELEQRVKIIVAGVPEANGGQA